MPTPDPSAAAMHVLAAFGVFIWLFVLCVILLQIIIAWNIASKAGYSGVLSLLMLVPLVNFVVLLIFAFSEWPIQRELAACRASQTQPTIPPFPPGTRVAPT